MSGAIVHQHRSLESGDVFCAPRPRPKAKATQSVAVGLVLVDSSLKVIYCNSEAVRVFLYPFTPVNGRPLSSKFAKVIRSIVEQHPPSANLTTSTVFLSGRRRYICRSFLLETDPGEDSKATIAITVERDRWALRDLAGRFQLTDREREAVENLANGLTSKEIAQCMNISPNTVKTFLSRVMIKMGVTTRTGVIGKIVEVGR